MSNDYWKKREEEAKRRAQKKQQEEYDKEIERIYRRALNAINEQISAWYIKYAQEEGISMSEARKRVNDLDIEAFAQLADKYVSEHNLSKQANQDMAIYNLTMKINRLELLKAQIGFELCKSTQELEEFMRKELEGRSLEEVERLAGILGQSVMDIKDRVLAIPNASFHNATFSDRIWNNQALLKADLDKLLSIGLIRGMNPRELAKEIKTKMDTTTYNAERIMRTEMCRIQTEASRMSFDRMGFTQYEFIAGPGACEICQKVERENDGIYDMDKMEIGVNAPPMHPNCLCSIAPYENEDDYEEWLDGYKNHGMTFEEWKERKK